MSKSTQFPTVNWHPSPLQSGLITMDSELTGYFWTQPQRQNSENQSYSTGIFQIVPPGCVQKSHGSAYVHVVDCQPPTWRFWLRLHSIIETCLSVAVPVVHLTMFNLWLFFQKIKWTDTSSHSLGMQHMCTEVGKCLHASVRLSSLGGWHTVSAMKKSLMARWFEQASQWHGMYCHDLEVMSSHHDWVQLGVRGTSVLSRTWTKHISLCLFTSRPSSPSLLLSISSPHLPIKPPNPPATKHFTPLQLGIDLSTVNNILFLLTTSLIYYVHIPLHLIALIDIALYFSIIYCA